MAHFKDARRTHKPFNTTRQTPLYLNRELAEWPGKNRQEKRLARATMRLRYLEWKRAQ